MIKVNIFIPLVLTLLLASLNSEDTLAQTLNKPIATVTEVNGKVEVKSKTSLQYKPRKKGDKLYSGDLLRVRKGSRGTIVCTNNSTAWVIPNDGLPVGVANTCSDRKL